MDRASRRRVPMTSIFTWLQVRLTTLGVTDAFECDAASRAAAVRATRRGGRRPRATTAVQPITRCALARSLRPCLSRAGTETRCIRPLVALSSKAAPCLTPAARSRPLRHCAGRPARAVTAALPRSFASASAPCRSEPRRRGSQAGWGSAIPSTPGALSTSSAGRAATSTDRRCLAEPRGDDHAHPPPCQRLADLEIERRRSHPVGAARLARAAASCSHEHIERAAPAVVVRPSRSISLRDREFSERRAGREPVTPTRSRLAPV